jgi:hypothetical protein
MTAPTRAVLAERLAAHAQWQSDMDAAAALLAKPEPSETEASR